MPHGLKIKRFNDGSWKNWILYEMLSFSLHLGSISSLSGTSELVISLSILFYGAWFVTAAVPPTYVNRSMAIRLYWSKCTENYKCYRYLCHRIKKWENKMKKILTMHQGFERGPQAHVRKLFPTRNQALGFNLKIGIIGSKGNNDRLWLWFNAVIFSQQNYLNT